MHKILVILPALNEEKTIGDILDKISEVKISDANIAQIVIDDGSTDSTAKIAREKGIRVLSHERNLGVGAAFQSGLREAILDGFDILVSIDSDGQFDPQYIPELVVPIIEGTADFMTASRFIGNNNIVMPRIKRWGNYQIAKLVSNLSGQKIYDVSCGFRAYSRKAFLNLNIIGDFTYTHEAILNLAFRGFYIKEVPIPVKGIREHGESRVASNLFKYAFKSTLIIIRSLRDYKPIKTFGIPGIILFVLGSVFFSVFIVWSIIEGRFFPKVAAFAGAFSFLTGLVFFVIALLADMFTRMRVKMEKIIELMDKGISKE
jgi:glycosyltransferase involved in cell wall biosynthesis